MNLETGSVDTKEGWDYENESGEVVNAVDLGEVEDLTSGMINQKTVRQYMRCLDESDGNITYALQQGYDQYGLHAVAEQEDNDSWFEALARYKLNNNL